MTTLPEHETLTLFCVGCRRDVVHGPLAFRLTFAPMQATKTCPLCDHEIVRDVTGDVFRMLHDRWTLAALELSTFAVELSTAGPPVEVLERERSA